jgi:hypothetical protein
MTQAKTLPIFKEENEALSRAMCACVCVCLCMPADFYAIYLSQVTSDTSQYLTSIHVWGHWELTWKLTTRVLPLDLLRGLWTGMEDGCKHLPLITKVASLNPVIKCCFEIFVLSLSQTLTLIFKKIPRRLQQLRNLTVETHGWTYNFDARLYLCSIGTLQSVIIGNA